MWIGVLWAGLRVAMWITHVGGKFRHGLLEKSLNISGPAETYILRGARPTIRKSKRALARGTEGPSREPTGPQLEPRAL